MNPNHTYGGPTPGFYGGPGPGPGGYPPGGPGAYPPPHGAGPMSPYGGGGPMSPYSGQGHGQPPPGGQPTMYGNQNSPFHNQNQSSPYSGPGPGPYNEQSSGGFSAMQSYYNNQSPPSHPQHQFQFGGHGPGGHHRPHPGPSPPPLARGMPYPARIPHPTINSPNQNTVVTGNQIKTENMDLKAGSLYAPTAQGYNQSGFGYNGFGQTGAPQGPRPLMSPGGPPNLSPRAPGPPSMSPHHPLGSSGLYSQQQGSPGNNHGPTIAPASQASTFPPLSQHHQSYNAQFEYFNKQGQGQGQHGSPSYPGVKEEQYEPHRPPSFPSDERSLSDVQSNASARSTGDDTPKHSSFGEDSNTTQGSSITTLVNIKKEPGDATGDTTAKPPSDEKHNNTGDSDDKKFTPKSEPEDAKPEGSYFEDQQQKDFTLKANQNLIDNMNLDSIPELPEIPELKYEDMGEMKNNQSPGEEDERGPLGRVTMAEFMKNPTSDGFHDQWGPMQGRRWKILLQGEVWQMCIPLTKSKSPFVG